MKGRSSILAVLVWTTLGAGCDAWVEDVEEPATVIQDDQLNSEDQFEFLMNGVTRQFARAYGLVAFSAAILSDELIFDTRNRESAAFAFKEVDEAKISLENGLAEATNADVSELRFVADDLIRRLGIVDFTDSNLESRAKFNGYIYGAIARLLLAGYFGLTQREQGGVITEDPSNPGPFIPATEMYNLALEKLELARSLADAQQLRVINTIVARIHLISGEFAAARAAADAGMIPSDPPFQSLNDPGTPNVFWQYSGSNLSQLLSDFEYKKFVDADPKEAVRLPLVEVIGIDGTIFYIQNEYTSRSDPLDFCTWQENELMLAELDFREGNVGGALQHINAVRANYGLDALVSVEDLGVIEVERRKELLMMGLRLLDQRRFDSWHKGPDTWQNLPIPQSERDGNPNL